MVQAAGKSDIGLVRSNNEDRFGYDLRHGIFIVCDGMGGQAAGELASEIAVETILTYFRQHRRNSNSEVLGQSFEGVSERASALGNSIQLANQAIQEDAARNPQHAGMGSTIAAVLVERNLFSVANVGDSRVYLIRDGTIQQLTSDHSLVMEQVRRGLMTLDQAERSNLRNIIVRALGADDTVEPDLQDHEFSPHDVLLLCSDGLSRYVSESEIVEIIGRNGDLERACDDLIEAAKRGKSDDNITCVLLRASEQSWPGRMFGRLAAGKGNNA